MTPETRARTRQHFADTWRQAAANGESHDDPIPPDLPRYLEWCEANAIAALAGEHDHTFTFLQRAHYLETGESVALLP